LEYLGTILRTIFKLVLLKPANYGSFLESNCGLREQLSYPQDFVTFCDFSESLQSDEIWYGQNGFDAEKNRCFCHDSVCTYLLYVVRVPGYSPRV